MILRIAMEGFVTRLSLKSNFFGYKSGVRLARLRMGLGCDDIRLGNEKMIALGWRRNSVAIHFLIVQDRTIGSPRCAL
jgi:hypothetical protein